VAVPDQERDWFKDPPPRRVGALALITRRRRGEFLVINRSYWQAVSAWGLPGGSAEADELPRRALSRCLAEKLSLRVTAEEFLAVDMAPCRPWRYLEGFNFVFHVPVSGVEPAPVEGSGYAEARWVTGEQVADLAIDHELLRIEQCLRALHDGRVEDLLVGVPQHRSRTRSAAG
jgi:ADP-ribose pyrophosphatase YjhB (NUDIX family)